MKEGRGDCTDIGDRQLVDLRVASLITQVAMSGKFAQEVNGMTPPRKRATRSPALTAMLMLCAAIGPVTALANKPDAQQKTFIDNLLSQMTLQEKIGQLRMEYAAQGDAPQDMNTAIAAGDVGAMFTHPAANSTDLRRLQAMAVERSRLGIPLFFAGDVIHGRRTIFPINLGQASSWDLRAVEKSARVAAIEATNDGLDMTFAPVLDVSRDPRWGRISEGYGEDTHLASRMGEAAIRGLQRPHLAAPDSLMVCIKHFAGYGAVEGGRDYNTADMSEQRLHQDYLPPFKAAIEAKAGAVMTALSSLNGIPATANGWLLKDLLRTQWQFKGLVISDHGAVAELIDHGVARDGTQAAKAALTAGTQMSMSDRHYRDQLAGLIKQGQVSEAELDGAVRQVLTTKYELGLFDAPYQRLGADAASEQIGQHRAQARDMARRSLVLLKNRNRTLPLHNSMNIALIGPLADNAADMLGSWYANGRPEEVVTLRSGMHQAQAGKGRLRYAKGANIIDDPSALMLLADKHVDIDPSPPAAMLKQALAVARQADVIVAVLGEARGMSHEGASRTELGLPGGQRALLKALSDTGIPVVLVLMNGRPLALDDETKWADAVLETWYSGSEGGNAIADVLFGDYNPSGKLPVTFVRNVGQIPLYYNHLNTGRPFDAINPAPYRSRHFDVDDTPLFPFGFGLSYTQFDVSAPRLSTDRLRPGERLKVRVTVTNQGPLAGETTVQLYLRDLSASVSRPVKELKGFQNIFLEPGAARDLTLEIAPTALAFVDRNLQWVTEPGDFEVMVGLDSHHVKTATFERLP